MKSTGDIIARLRNGLNAPQLVEQPTADGIPTAWIPADKLADALRLCKDGIDNPYAMLYDLTAIDERRRQAREGQPESDFTAVYHLFSFDRNAYLRLKVPLSGDSPGLPSATSIWKNADWLEREIWDMFGLRFEGHPNLRRLLMPTTWQGHPLRKDHPARATEMGPYSLPDEKMVAEQAALKFDPAEWGMDDSREHTDYMYLNLGPQHPGTHGVIRFALQLDGEEIVDSMVDIGYHHRGAEKMAERQTWHSYIPYTDRIDYLGGVMNNLAYLLSVEKLAGIQVPPRAQVIRVMLCELFRIASHLVWYGTFAADIGSLSPVFYMFSDRERIFGIIEAICGGRMHPSWFRIGGVAHDLPQGWDRLVRDYLDYQPKRLDEYDKLVMKNRIFKARTQGIGDYTTAEAIEWGVTGPGLRATGFEWDFRRQQPYCGYEQFEFDVPTASRGDCYDRAVVRIEEIRQSLRIVRQCLDHMPAGPTKAEHALAVPPEKARTMQDIETLIDHFVGVSWGPAIEPGEALVGIEASKGNNGYYLVADRGTGSYRTRIRTPSFVHLQMVPWLSKQLMIPDLMAILGSIDFVLADVDR
jgi:NADH-quinone oxidoreductase subunit C/D